MEEDKIVGMAIDAGYAKFIHSITKPEDIPDKPEALEDVVVLDLSYGNYAGIFASSILAELGAEVIKVEPPEGDIARKMTPYGIMVGDAGLAYITEGRNKFHITLDITKDEGKEILKRFVRKADVLIETFKPGYMDSLGIGYRQLKEVNPRLIYAAIYTYGQFGKDAEKYGNQPDYDLIDQARGVIMSVTGEPELDPEVPQEYKRPLKHGNWHGWYMSGGWAAFGILLALFYRSKTGKGQFIDCAPPEGLVSVSNYVIQYYHMTGKQMVRAGNFDYAVFPYTYVKSKDGYTFMSGFTDPNWAALCEIMNRPDLQKKFPTIKERLTPENQPIIQHEIEKFTTQYTSAELLQIITEYSRKPDKKGTVVTGRLNAPIEVPKFEHWKIKRMFVKMNDPHYGEVFIPNSLFRYMSRTPGRVKWACRPIGADNELIYNKYLGISGKKLEELKEKGVI
ncbi:CoA transferase [Archaeoglobales archaeon]|nr:MAG: carnitine dehydratase [Archaeoglobales archaeon ex4484_92]RLI81801.1 MAG: CoA transferase [Archaeoglobales archaeon]HDN74406.1 CoA transferase [Archaeoglobus sp.]